MSGEFNGLKTLIMRENEFAYYVHCFAHQLQLAIIGLAKKHSLIGAFFTLVSNVDKQAPKVVEALTNGELSSGKVDVLDEIANDRLTFAFDEEYTLNYKCIVTTLRRDDQDIVNAMDLVELCKQQFMKMRENG
ncbi:unnamed protein product [Prunus armeniaca]